MGISEERFSAAKNVLEVVKIASVQFGRLEHGVKIDEALWHNFDEKAKQLHESITKGEEKKRAEEEKRRKLEEEKKKADDAKRVAEAQVVAANQATAAAELRARQEREAAAAQKLAAD